MISTWHTLSNWCLIMALICFALLLIFNRPKGNHKMQSSKKLKLNEEEFNENSDEFMTMVRTRFGEPKAKVIEAGISGKMFLVALASGLACIDNEEIRDKLFEVGMDYVKLNFSYAVEKELGPNTPREAVEPIEQEINHFMRANGLI